MNLTQYLQHQTKLDENYISGNTTPVVIGYTTLYPFHIGHLNMISEMIVAGIEHDAEVILSIVKQNTPGWEEHYDLVEHIMKDQFPGITIQVTSSMFESLGSINDNNKYPALIYCTPIKQKEAYIICKKLFEQNIPIKSHNVAGIDALCKKALNENDVIGFGALLAPTYENMYESVYAIMKGEDGKQ